ncbi:MAG: hypothetical protein GQ583_05105 [Methyloprofundus sp.]|nr:hypothetical protein [Methyloprofundus sp.]
MKQNVISREYKIMLKKEQFVGLRLGHLEQAECFWRDFKNSIQAVVFDTDGNLDKVEKQRTISFYDSADCYLRENNYVFRERVDLITEKREVTLKFRHPDRYISQDRDMSAADTENAKTKFEEDIKPPFLKLYSFSTKQPIPDGKVINKMNDPGELFPDLKTRLKSYQEDMLIDKVGDFIAKEMVIEGADFQIGNNPKVEAECALVAWYDDNSDEPNNPIVVEFSFKYGDDDENFDGEVAQRAYDVFECLQGMAEWVELEGTTKTAYVYSKV